MNTQPATSDPPLYHGWWRQHKRQPWQKLVTAETYGDCWNRLLDSTTDKRNGELLVTMNSDPNHGA